MGTKLLVASSLLAFSTISIAAPTVAGNTINWPDDGWYQVQDAQTFESQCEGQRSCDVQNGTYVVINHTTGERFNDIVVTGTTNTPDSIVVIGNTISWPNDGWYQVQDATTYESQCGGLRSCDVENGTYVVINHTTGERFTDIVVGGSTPSTANSIVVTDNTISWPDDGWYQVQDAQTYQSICEGGLSCSVDNGTYIVINHTKGERFSGIVVDTGNALVQVDVNITVPAYQSDALQVRLMWGETDVTAAWVGDELWSTSLELPTNTENTLSVLFSDRNGGIELASFEQDYRTGGNAAEVFDIEAVQFNSEKWDADNDGISNLDELIAGTNPLRNENLNLEVRETYLVTAVELVSAYHEQSISSERPFSFSREELPPINAGFNEVRQTHIISIEIDASGNGVFSDNFEFRDTNDSDITTEDQEATRARTENSVLWAGTYRRRNSSSQVSEDIDFSIETQSIDDQTVQQDGSVQRTLRGRGSLDFEQDLSYSLTGEALDDSPNCTPSSGTLTNRVTNTRSFPLSGSVTVATKESDDTLWSVRVTDLEGELIEEYLARSLTADFYCEFTDL